MPPRRLHAPGWALLLSALCGAAAPPPALGQDTTGAFRTLRVSLDAVVNADPAALGRFWITSPGAGAHVETPFYYGRARAGVLFLAHESPDESRPDFQAFYLYLGGGRHLALPGRFGARIGFTLGSFWMRFDDADAGKTVRSESELAAGLFLGLSRPLAAGWEAGLSGSYLTVFTHRRIRYPLLSAGISRSFATPGWLRSFLSG